MKERKIIARIMQIWVAQVEVLVSALVLNCYREKMAIAPLSVRSTTPKAH